ncbi:unnamed protein product [Rangifer tarandus platyrhynchus]|uniref:Uncharacterized protein n=2 Tax=Rangifer tarandus platyrhynchus TaxID=3082113 RepID=A0ABN8Z332_RANTA|nr:unnamed protein product [Rangifer tarandus platyrhynchus]CAI9703360.1 unnamed protein product [Rangifer tarandus platyrhynchus]
MVGSWPLAEEKPPPWPRFPRHSLPWSPEPTGSAQTPVNALTKSHPEMRIPTHLPMRSPQSPDRTTTL